MTKRFLYLIRNGHYARHDGGEGPLTEIGQRQVSVTIQALRGFPFMALYHSPHLQVEQTALAFAQAFGLDARSTDLLRQYDDQIKFSTLTRNMLMNALQAQHDQIENAYETFVVPPCDSDEHIILVCHANIIRDLICRALNVNPSSWAHMLINHCGISCLSVEAVPDGRTRVELLSYNDVNHLPDSLHTEN
ncbi:MAG: histidine phosphatase family protein [Anaerolineae bacterium]|nr:histidine phosphatase family protein [Anaerolineae bacterium]MDW8171933.1 histidine phosphatase family protein [Anaerolineae bacterium]